MSDISQFEGLLRRESLIYVKRSWSFILLSVIQSRLLLHFNEDNFFSEFINRFRARFKLNVSFQQFLTQLIN